MSKPSLARGTRDFGPEVMVKRNFIFDTIKKIYQKYGFLPLETPSFENLSVLMGKYGDEGDQLLFKILNSGDYLKDIQSTNIEEGSKKLLTKISEKGLKYDLTVPFARYVVMNRHLLTFPFKRYQIQPVWRADRPQKGRYREFYQCDADVVGTDSLICEAEIVAMLTEIFEGLGIQDFVIKINNRKILTGISEVIGASGKEQDLCVAIDKIDKIGKEAVEKELAERGFSSLNIERLQPLFELGEEGLFAKLENWLQESEIGIAGVTELKSIWKYIELLGLKDPKIAFDPSLARGLSYYTGAIFEVKALGVQIGSISGGGRYDNLTGTFGMPGTSGVGISVGVDRVYDVMEELKLFPEQFLNSVTQVMVTNFDEDCIEKSLDLLAFLRANTVNAEIFPEYAKMKKQFEYAHKKNIPFVLIVGLEEINAGIFKLKNMQTGEQISLEKEQLISTINA